jgi:SAM-dependent methyltransferase
VKHLQVCEANADFFRGLRVKEDRRRDEFADFKHDAVCGGGGRKGGVGFFVREARFGKAAWRAGTTGHELARRGLQVRAVDISRTLVEIAKHKASAEGVMPHFESGNAAALPLEDASLEFVVCRAAFKNFSAPVKALAEIRRVLRLGGTALVIDDEARCERVRDRGLCEQPGSEPMEPLADDADVPHDFDPAGLPGWRRFGEWRSRRAGRSRESIRRPSGLKRG